jgi:hypothetical protein
MPSAIIGTTATDIQVSTIKQCRPQSTCCHLVHPSSIDLPSSPSASLRRLVPSHLTELEDALSDRQLEFPDLGMVALKSRGEITVEGTALDMPQSLRSDACSHLPDLGLDSTVGDVSSVPNMMNDDLSPSFGVSNNPAPTAEAVSVRATP